MKIRQVGFLNVGMGISMALITSSYAIFANQKELIAQSILGTGIALLQFAIGYELIKTKEKKRSIIPQIKIIKYEKEEKMKPQINKSELSKDELTIFSKLEKKNEILQSELMKDLKFNKVKISRTLKKLEEKNLIEKKKKGMNNLIVLKN